MRILGSMACAAMALALGGCGTIYSTQMYGSPAMKMVSAGATKTDVFANLGSPNSVYKSDGGEVFVYKYQKGTNILGLYAKVMREDTVVVLDSKGSVTWVATVPVGEGMTILAPPMLDATHPVPTSELMFDPENYTYEYGIEE